MTIFSTKCLLHLTFYPAKMAKNKKHHCISVIQICQNIYLETSKRLFENLAQVSVRNPDLGSNSQNDLRPPDIYFDAY